MPYSNHQVVERLFGSTAPVSVTVVTPTLCAAPVWTAGATEVENVRSAPYVVPPLFEATIRKW